MTDRGSRGSLKRSRNLEGETSVCSKLQVRHNSVLTAGDVPAAATVITVPISAASRRDGDRTGSNSPAAKECRITRNRWSRDGIKSNVQKKRQDEVKGFSEHLLLGRSNSCSKLLTKRQRDEPQMDESRYPFRRTSLKETSDKSMSSKNIQRSDSIVERLTGAFQNTTLGKEDTIQRRKEQKHSRKESLKRRKSSERRLLKQNSQNVSENIEFHKYHTKTCEKESESANNWGKGDGEGLKGVSC